MSVRRWRWVAMSGTVPSNPPLDTGVMTESIPTQPRARLAPAGLMFLAITSIGWGLNWPVSKYLLGMLPPLTLRGDTGVVGALLLALLALMRGESLMVPRSQWPRLVISALLNVTVWMVLIGLALVWLPATETALIGYTMPIWAAMLAWPMLGERPSPLRFISLLMAFAGLAAILGGNGLNASMEKWPGMALALAGAIGFGLGAVFTKKYPLQLRPLPGAAWQIMVGCLPIGIAGLWIEHPHLEAITPFGWTMLFYSVVIAFCVCYLTWFAAIRHLPASIAAIGTMAVPVIGVVVSAAVLHEPLGIGQILALLFTLAGVVLATRS
jgi:drug/metabolite transporter (DMT)-like permease